MNYNSGGDIVMWNR